MMDTPAIMPENAKQNEAQCNYIVDTRFLTPAAQRLNWLSIAELLKLHDALHHIMTRTLAQGESR